VAADQPTHEGLARVADQPVVARPSLLPAPSAPRRLSWRRRQVGAAAAAASAAAVGPASAAGRAALSPPSTQRHAHTRGGRPRLPAPPAGPPRPPPHPLSRPHPRSRRGAWCAPPPRPQHAALSGRPPPSWRAAWLLWTGARGRRRRPGARRVDDHRRPRPVPCGSGCAPDCVQLRAPVLCWHAPCVTSCRPPPRSLHTPVLLLRSLPVDARALVNTARCLITCGRRGRCH